MNNNIVLFLMLAVGFLLITVIIDRILNKDDEEHKELLEQNHSVPILEKETDFSKLIQSFSKEANPFQIPIGTTEEKNIKSISLKENLLVLGTTGGGKSILLNEIISAIAMNYTKEEIRIVTMDTSIVELSSFNGIPHYIKNTISNPQEITEELETIKKEIENRKNKENQPTLVVVMDDLFDICSYSKNNQVLLEALLENGPKENVYFIIATDTPSKELLTENMKKQINGICYLTLAPGEAKDFAFEKELTNEEQDFLATIGNMIYKEGNIKERIIVPEVLEEEMKLIKNGF